MIVKLGQELPGLEKFMNRRRLVWAMRMREDFIVETGRGWLQGRRGEWVVLCGDLWNIIEDKQFTRSYQSTEVAIDG